MSDFHKDRLRGVGRASGRPIGRWSKRVALLGLLLFAFAGWSGAATLRRGDLILSDRSADPLFYHDSRGALFLVGPDPTEHVIPLASPVGFLNPTASIVRYDGKIVVADADADPAGLGGARGALFLVDPTLELPGVAEVFATSPAWDNPADVMEEPSGDYLVLDSDADPLRLGNRPGALFRVDRESREVTLVAANIFFSDPRSMMFDIDGKVLVWDQRANPRQLPGLPGALFRIDPSNGNVEVIFSFAGVFTSPGGIALDANGDYLILDRDANPEGLPYVAPGAIFRVRRIDLTVEPIFTDPLFVEPYDFVLDPTGDVWVLDRRAYEGDVLHAGALFRCDLSTGEITRKEYSDYFSTLSGLTQFAGTPLDASTVTCDDLSGQPLEPGDRVRVTPRVHNGFGNDLRVTFTHSITSLWDFRVGSGSAPTGEITYDPTSRTVNWTGDVPPGGDVDFAYEIRLHDEAPVGTAVHEPFAVAISGASSQTALFYDAVVQPGATPGRTFWADYEVVAGVTEGVIFERQAEQVAPVRIFHGAPLVTPDDLAFLPSGEVLVLDRLSYPRGPTRPPGGIYKIDPATSTIDTLLAFEDYPSFRTPVGIAGGAPDQLLIVDKDANPLGYAGSPGAVYGLDLSSMEILLVATSPQFSEPVDAFLESTGLILVVDIDANPSGLYPHAGALFEVEPSTAQVRALPHPANTFADPIGVAEGLDGKVFVADFSADPLHLGRNTGCVFVVDRLNDNTVQVFSADGLYVDPTDVVARLDGSVIVTDRDANPFNLPPRDYGAVFQVARTGGRPSVYSASPIQYGPSAAAVFTGGDLRTSDSYLVDVNGPPLLQGDTLRFEVMIHNTGRLTIPEAMANVILSPHLGLIDVAGADGVIIDPLLPGLNWVGSVLPKQTIGLTIRSRVDMEGIDFGTIVHNRLELSGPPGAIRDSSGARVMTRLGTGDMMLVDSNADPEAGGSPRGALYLVRSSTGSTDLILPSSPQWFDPTALERFDEERVLLVDPMGPDPARVYLVDYLRETTSTYIDDERLGNPADLLRTRTGDLLIVDPQAILIPQGASSPVVFVQRAGQQGLSIFTQGPQLRQPSQVVEDEEGRLWLVDRNADPNPAAPGVGALFRLDAVTGAIIDTLQYPEFTAPTGVTAWDDRGLIVVDSRASVSPSSIGAVFHVDPDRDTLQTLVTDSRFIQLRNATLSASGDIWLVDRFARDGTMPDRPHVLFRYNPTTTRLDAVPLPSDAVTPSELYAFPSPAPRFMAYGYEDLNGPPLQPGDDLLFRARVGNVGVKPTMGAAFQDSLPLWVVLDPSTILTDTGSVQTVEGRNFLIWNLDLPGQSSFEISYRGKLRPDTPQGQVLDFRSHVWTAEGVHRIRKLDARMPILFEDGFFYLADGEADPFGLGSGYGTLWKINLLSAQFIAMGSSTAMKQPVNATVLPALRPEILLVDSSANPMGYTKGQGALWRWDPESLEFDLIVADSTFMSPRTAVPISDHEVLLLDAEADPFDLFTRPDLPGAIYYVDVAAKTVRPYYSDSLIATPRDIVLDGRGGVFVIDSDADPGNFGFRGGAVFHVDLLQKRTTLYCASADFRGPIAGTIGPDGLLYVLDRDATLTVDPAAHGGVFRIDRMGNAELYATSVQFRRPTHLSFTAGGGLMVSDEIADPSAFGELHGAVFLQPSPGSEFGVLVASRRTKMPGGFFVRDSLTPIEVTGLEATAVEDGIRIRWQVPEARFEGFVCMRAEGEEPPAESFEFLNLDNPVPGDGPWEYLDGDLSPGGTYAYKIGAIVPGGGMRIYGPIVARALLTQPFALFPAAPNPAIGSTTLSFRIPRAGRTVLRLYELSGRLVRTLSDETFTPGRKTIVWDGRNDLGHRVASGMYFVRLRWVERTGKERTAEGRVILLR